MVKNITLSAEEGLIEIARQRAQREQRSLNQVFREWIAEYAGARNRGDQYERFMAEVDYIDAGRAYSREEMNER